MSVGPADVDASVTLVVRDLVSTLGWDEIEARAMARERADQLLEYEDDPCDASGEALAPLGSL